MIKSTLTPSEKVRQCVWSFLVYPVFPWFEKNLNFLHEKKRQPYHLGWLAPGKDIQDLKKHLATEWGFGNHFVSWTDSDQILSWRKLISFREQYHIRIFKDGEIRGHHELTPEYAPIRHFQDVGQSARTEDFLKFLGEFITSKEHISVISEQEAHEQISFAPLNSSKTVVYRRPWFFVYLNKLVSPRRT